MPIALISVYDKTGLAELAGALAGAGWNLLASGGTARALSAAGITATEVAAHTGSPEILGGRVKTLHPAIHGVYCRAAPRRTGLNWLASAGRR